MMARAGVTYEPSSPTALANLAPWGGREAFHAAIRLGGSGDASNAPTSRPLDGWRLPTVTMTLPPPPSTRPSATRRAPEDQAWADQCSRSWWTAGTAYLERNEPELALAVLRRRPRCWKPWGVGRKQAFYQSIAMQRAMQNAGASTRRTSQYAQGSGSAAQGGDEKEIGYATFFVGCTEVARRLVEARSTWRGHWPWRNGSGRSSCERRACSPAVTALRRHDVEAVRSWPTGVTARGRHFARVRSRAKAASPGWHGKMSARGVVTLTNEARS